jgi:hypothetical protein
MTLRQALARANRLGARTLLPMRRALFLVPALFSAVLFATTGQAAHASEKPRAAIAPKPSGPDASAEFDLGAGNGLTAHLETFTDLVTLTIYGHHQYVSYQVEGEVSASGVFAQFGKLGQVSVTFTPAKNSGSKQPPNSCHGEVEAEQKGVFSGIIELTGEREYVRLDATSAKGEMQVPSNFLCSSQKGAPPPPSDKATNERAAEKGDVATLSASNRKLQRSFIAGAQRNPKGRGYTFFAGGLAEHRESMKIFRLAELTAPPSTFHFNHANGTATVRPPLPFSGSASFERRRGGPPTWSGSLKVPLLGADPIALTGPGFKARLVRDFPGD